MKRTVRTMVGRAEYSRTREATTFPEAWKERRAIGIKSIENFLIEYVVVPNVGGGDSGFLGESSEALPLWIRIAEVIMKIVWRKKDRMRTQRRRGEKTRWRVEKKRAPRMNAAIAVSDFSHSNTVALVGRFEIPRAAKIVFPVCWRC